MIRAQVSVQTLTEDLRAGSELIATSEELYLRQRLARLSPLPVSGLGRWLLSFHQDQSTSHDRQRVLHLTDMDSRPADAGAWNPRVLLLDYGSARERRLVATTTIRRFDVLCVICVKILLHLFLLHIQLDLQ